MTLATCAKDVKFYEWPSISYIGIYEPPPECISVRTISWSCAGNEILAVKSNGNAVVMNAPQQPEDFVEPFDLDVSHVTVGAFSSTNPNLIGFGCEDGRVFTYDLDTNMKLDRYTLPSAILQLEFSNDDSMVALGCLDSQIVLCDNSFKPCASFVIPNSPTLSCMTYSKMTPHLLAAGSRDGVLALWDTVTTDNILTCRHHTGRIADIAFNNNWMCTVGADGKFSSYDLRSYERHATLDYDCSLSSLAFLPGCWEMAVSTTSGQLRSYDFRNLKAPLTTYVPTANGTIKKIAFPTRMCTPITSTYTNKSFDEEMSASGDFSILTDSSLKPSKSANIKSTSPVVPPLPSISSESESPSAKPAVSINAEDFLKALEDMMASATRDFEEKIVQAIYALRLTNSKRFTEIEEKIACMNDFISYVRTSGPVKDKFSNLGTPPGAYGSWSLENNSQDELEKCHFDLQ